jgi:hypothetical protein
MRPSISFFAGNGRFNSIRIDRHTDSISEQAAVTASSGSSLALAMARLMSSCTVSKSSNAAFWTKVLTTTPGDELRLSVHDRDGEAVGFENAIQMVDDRLPFFRRGQIIARVGDADQEPRQLFVGVVILRHLAEKIDCRWHPGPCAKRHVQTAVEEKQLNLPSRPVNADRRRLIIGSATGDGVDERLYDKGRKGHGSWVQC